MVHHLIPGTWIQESVDGRFWEEDGWWWRDVDLLQSHQSAALQHVGDVPVSQPNIWPISYSNRKKVDKQVFQQLHGIFIVVFRFWHTIGTWIFIHYFLMVQYAEYGKACLMLCNEICSRWAFLNTSFHDACKTIHQLTTIFVYVRVVLLPAGLLGR